MKPFCEDLRYDYALLPESIVIDVGAHKGVFAGILHQKHGCKIHCYEPVEKFHEACYKRFLNNDDILVYDYGLGGESRYETFKIKGDMSGMFAEGPEEIVQIKSIAEEMAALGNPGVALLKINIENGEYELLDAIIDNGLVKNFKDIQVQFHGGIPDAVARREKIRAALALTHHETYCEPFVWENWSLRS